MSNASHHLLRVTHDEALESVAHRADARVFHRTSYCVAPPNWRELTQEALRMRVRVLLEAAVRHATWTLRDSDDPVGMALLDYDFAWVAPAEVGSRPWTACYFAWRVDDSGGTWHLVHHPERAAEFDARLLPDSPKP